uniref:Angiotensin II receptor-associated protein n=1 Tax=Crotalus horridus TaxID=35024 RepID=A0A0K8RZE0_CROHD
MEIPAVNLKAIVLVHWLLTIWGCMDSWLPQTYDWSNFTVLALGVWAIAQRDSVDAIFMFLTGLLLTILTDIVHFSLYYQVVERKLTDTSRFCTGMAIFSLLLKPLSCYFAYQMYRERGGEYALNLGVLGVSQETSAYQSIETPDPPRPYPDVASRGAQPPSY